MGRQIKNLSIAGAALIIGLLLVGLYPLPALAADPPAPANLQIESAKAFRNVVEDGDFVFVFHHNIHYAEEDQPDDPANKLFTFRLLDTNGVDHLASIVPYVYYNSGYDQGCAAFYFTADEVEEKEMAWESTYIVRISGNPEYFSSPPLTNRTLVTSDYSQVETQEENQTLLGNYILDIARALEVNWDTQLLYPATLGTVLYSTGETYFRGAIPGIQAMAPQIFATQSTSPEYPDTEWEEAQGKAYGVRFDSTWVGEVLEDFGELFHIKWNFLTGLIILGEIIGIGVWCQVKYGNVKPLSISSDILIIGGTILGWIAPAILAITTVFLALFTGYVLIFRHG